MNAITNDVLFVTLEDISDVVQPNNYVIYNPVLPPARRMELFQKFMATRYRHKFTKEELDYLVTFNEYNLLNFIHAVRNIIQSDQKH